MLKDQRETAFAYDHHTKAFSEKFVKNFELFVRADAEKFLSELKGKKILDAGCGPGIELEFFREKGMDALGIDLSDAFLEICTEKGLNTRKMDMENPLLWPHAFDGIWAHASVLHVPKGRIPSLVEKWIRLLKHDGLLWVAVKEGNKEGMEPDGDNPPRERWMSYFTIDELKSFFDKKFEPIYEVSQSMPNGIVWLKVLFRVKPK